MSEDIFVVNVNDDEYESVDILDIESDIDLDERVHVIEVEDSESMTVETFDAFNALGEPNEQLKHQLLNGRDTPDQHPITAITGLKEKLDDIEALDVVYSDERHQANYYLWEDENILEENRVGYFVSACSDINKIKICNANNDIFGVTVDSAGFIGSQSDIARDIKYGLVVTTGLVHVRCESSVKVGDYVISNNYGYAKTNNNGYKVVGRHQIDGVEYVAIALVTPIGRMCELTDEVEKLGDRMDDAETNIVAAMNVANAAYNKAGEVGEVSEEAIKNALNALEKANGASEKTDGFEVRLEDANKLAVQAKAIAESATVAAYDMTETAKKKANETLESANATLADAKKYLGTVEELEDWTYTNEENGKTYTGVVGVGSLLKDNSLTLNSLVGLKDPETGEINISGLEAKVKNNESVLDHITNHQGKNSLTIAQIEQKANDNGASITSMVSSVDKYSVGEYSQAYGLTKAQAASILKPGYIYVPTAHKYTNSHKEKYGDEENEFTPGNYYEWNVTGISDHIKCIGWDSNGKDKQNVYYDVEEKKYHYYYNDTWGETKDPVVAGLEIIADWTEYDDEVVFSQNRPSNSEGTYKFWYLNSKEPDAGYEAYALYLWDYKINGEYIAIQGGWNANEKYSENIYFTTEDVKYYYYDGTEWKGVENPTEDNVLVEKLDIKWDWRKVNTLAGNASNRAVSMIRQTTNEIAAEVTNARGDIAGLNVKIDENREAQVAMVASVVNKDGTVNTASIINSVNNDKSSIAINADHIVLNGYTSNANGSFQIDKDGYMIAKGGNIGGWIIEGNKPEDFGNVVFIGDSYTKNKAYTYVEDAEGNPYNPDSYSSYLTEDWTFNKLKASGKINSDEYRKGWPYYCANSLGISSGNYFDAGQSGSGFCFHNIDTNPNTDTFQKRLEKMFTEYKDNTWRKSITHIIIGGGFNDATTSASEYCHKNLSAAIDAFAVKLESLCSKYGINPKVYLFALGKSCGTTSSLIQKNSNLIKVYNLYEEKAKLYGWKFYDLHNTWQGVNGGGSNYVGTDTPNKKSYTDERGGDTTHPNTTGLMSIGSTVASYLKYEKGRLYNPPAGYEFRNKYSTDVSSTLTYGNSGFYLSNRPGDWAIEIGAKAFTYENVGGSTTLNRPFMVGQNGTLWAQNARISGTINATSGKIGGWNITNNYLDSTVSNSKCKFYIASANNDVSNWIRADDKNGDRSFSVTKEGYLYAQGADISGTINATNGKIGGWKINETNILNDYVYKDNNQVTQTTRFYISNDDNASYWLRVYDKVKVDQNPSATDATYCGILKDGTLYAQGANIKGTIDATEGAIGGWTIDGSQLKTGNNTKNAFYISSSSSTAGNWVKAYDNSGNVTFRVSKDGGLYATSGKIGGWNITDNYLDSTVTGSKHRFYIASASSTAPNWIYATDAFGNGSFSVTKDGYLYATGATISGEINATNGNFSDSITIGGTSVTAANLRGLYSYATGGSGTAITQIAATSGSVDFGKYFSVSDSGAAQMSNDGGGFLTLGANTTHPYVSALNVAIGDGGINFLDSGGQDEVGTSRFRMKLEEDAYATGGYSIKIETKGNIHINSRHGITGQIKIPTLTIIKNEDGFPLEITTSVYLMFYKGFIVGCQDTPHEDFPMLS